MQPSLSATGRSVTDGVHLGHAQSKPAMTKEGAVSLSQNAHDAPCLPRPRCQSDVVQVHTRHDSTGGFHMGQTPSGSAIGAATPSASGTPSAAGLCTKGLSLKLQPLNWEKEHWDGVHSNVKTAFQTVSNNQNRLQTWTDQVEVGMRLLDGDKEKMRGSLDIALSEIEETKVNVQDLTLELGHMSDMARTELDASHSCTKQLLEVTSTFLAFFVSSISNGSRDNPFGGSQPSGDSHNRCDSAELSVLDQMQNLSQKLGTQHDLLDGAFDTWNQWRASKDAHSERLEEKSAEILKASEHTRDRLIQWREMLKENTHVVDSLSSGLAETRSKLRAMEAVQVLQEDVDDAIREKVKDSIELRNKAEQRVNEVATALNMSMAEAEESLRNSEISVTEQIAGLRHDVKTLLVDNLNPVNAYMNTMHVNISRNRMELDEFAKQVPELQVGLKAAIEKLGHCQEDNQEQRQQLGVQLKVLISENRTAAQKGERELGELQDTVGHLQKDFSGHLEQLHTMLAGNSEALENIKQGDLARVNREFLTLEQKVAKWIRTDPMPTKINEARLYALEAQLAQQMESHMLLEENQRSYTQMSSQIHSGSISSRVSMGVALPMLSGHSSPRIPDEQRHGSLSARSARASKASMRGMSLLSIGHDQ